MKKYILVFLLIIYFILNYLELIPKKFYYADSFDIEVVVSDIDYNSNGIDDYKDILIGALKEAKRHPKYKSTYYANGYPPDNEGVCTDVIWRSLKEAGYDLKSLIDNDIRNNLESYPNIKIIDSNIDFRRVPNIKTYLERNALVLTTDIKKIEEFQPGDIVVFNTNHVGIISDKRNKKGIPYLIHNAGQINFEEDTLKRYSKNMTGHFRFKLENIDKN